MCKLTNKTNQNSLIWQTLLCLSILLFSPDNKWLGPTFGCNLINSATLVFTKFEISKHPTFLYCLFWNVFEYPNLHLQLFNYTNLRQFLFKNCLYFSGWIVHLYFLELFTDFRWLDSLLGWYLWNSATLVVTKFQISKHPTFVERHIWHFLEPSDCKAIYELICKQKTTALVISISII